MSEDLDKILTDEKLPTTLAKFFKILYQELKNVGFNDEQALDLCKAFTRTVKLHVYMDKKRGRK